MTMKEKRSNEVIISMPTPVNQIFSIMERENVMKFFRSLQLETFFTFSGLGFFLFSLVLSIPDTIIDFCFVIKRFFSECVYIKKISMNIKFQLLFPSRIFHSNEFTLSPSLEFQKFHRVCYCLQYIKLGFRHAGSSFSSFP